VFVKSFHAGIETVTKAPRIADEAFDEAIREYQDELQGRRGIREE